MANPAEILNFAGDDETALGSVCVRHTNSTAYVCIRSSDGDTLMDENEVEELIVALRDALAMRNRILAQRSAA